MCARLPLPPCPCSPSRATHSPRSPTLQGFAHFSMALYRVNSPSDPRVHHHARHPLSCQLVLQVLHPDRRSLHPLPHLGSRRLYFLSMDSTIRRLRRDPFLRGWSNSISAVNHPPLTQLSLISCSSLHLTPRHTLSAPIDPLAPPCLSALP